VLLLPPSLVERTSLGRFTGTPTLNEKFTTAYIRFNDQTFEELRPQLRPLEEDDVQDGKDFLTRWNGAALSLAEADRLRLLVPVAGASAPARDHMLHARIGGSRLGSFDVYFDSLAAEQVRVVQSQSTERGGTFLNVWTSFSPEPQRRAGEDTANQP